MSLFRLGSGSYHPSGSILQITALKNVVQIRTATKKVSGSKTNKNDSAGRRLGPKVHEGNFVKPGQIIMRQRGSKIHPGENVKIGIDHTVYAVEPGYVHFYHDPFHPLRKYVGVSLKKNLPLPTPHFAPRVRRFGYELIEDPSEAVKEEQHMSRKEYLYQPKLDELSKAREENKSNLLSKFNEFISKELSLELGAKDLNLTLERYYNVHELVKLKGMSVESAETQTTYNYVHSLKLAKARGDLSSEEFEDSLAHYHDLVDQLSKKITVDATGALTKYLSAEEKASRKDEIIEKLETEYSNRVLSIQDKIFVGDLIATPGVFDVAEREDLAKKYLPLVVPLTVPGSVIENIDARKPPKGVIVQRIFDEATRSTRVVGRPKEVFATQ
ncbi:mitochondrial large ribosomal subunit [Scheffersomyces xylosifermentans]|uniref:mitochondrial large ribosomal subunit n=1 Tax=Scheffersomyces xylosifermentans TaxID=1304137 RepID=UPI00315CB8C9